MQSQNVFNLNDFDKNGTILYKKSNIAYFYFPS